MMKNLFDLTVNYGCCGGCCGGGESDGGCCGGACSTAAANPKKIVVTGLKDAADDQIKKMEVGGKKLILVKHDGKFFALDGTCTHKGGALGKGLVLDGKIVCPLHGAEFDLASGTVAKGPAEKPLKTYKIDQRGDELTIHLEE